MIGSLPRALDVCGRKHPIRADFRVILRIIAAFQDEELQDNEKVYVCLKNLYRDFEEIPADEYADAYKAAVAFIDFGIHEDRPGPRIVDWGHDEHLIFPAVNKAAGREVRAEAFLHWWTFMGYFQSIDREDTYGYVLMIRQKKARHKKLEKWEQDFYTANRNLIALKPSQRTGGAAEDKMRRMFQEMLAERGDNDG